MADIIQLLPDAIANQIAAGEVIQRPASVVKELMENAIDAGATSVKLIVKEAGKNLIQVIDDGCGMTETDARLSFERHATSKIRQADDLFAIRTMGFRGEALASVAAVAQVEMRTRIQSEELGVRLAVEGSEVKKQEPCQCTAGTNIAVKNLFFNVPARRNFLKSNAVEMRHIIDEFQRIAMANPDIFFSLHHNNSELFHLPPGNLRQRVVSILGGKSNKKLVPVQEETDALNIYGFVGKPEFAKKTRGDQYFFVNQRFIRSNYLKHAVMSAFDSLISKDAYPLYVIFIDIDPERIDINVHPTKQEIKFDDERLVYHYLKVAVRHALGQHNIIPSIDFDQEPSFSNYPTLITRQQASIPFQEEPEKKSSSGPFFKGDASFSRPSSPASKDWQQLYEGLKEWDPPQEKEESGPITIKSQATGDAGIDDAAGSFSQQQRQPYQVHGSYIINHIKSGFVLIDQQAAHERILYERYLAVLEEKESLTQKELFPKNIQLNAADAEIFREMLPAINQLGFDIKEFGQDSFIVHGVPADISSGIDEQQVIEDLLEQYKHNAALKLGLRDNLARSMARSSSIKRGQTLSLEEMEELIDKLFACAMPYNSPGGRNCFITFDLDELDRKFAG
jgi:DNA mismatch repair protein MutL